MQSDSSRGPICVFRKLSIAADDRAPGECRAVTTSSLLVRDKIDVNPANDTTRPHQITLVAMLTRRSRDRDRGRGFNRGAELSKSTVGARGDRRGPSRHRQCCGGCFTDWSHMARMRVSFPVCNIPNDGHTPCFTSDALRNLHPRAHARTTLPKRTIDTY